MRRTQIGLTAGAVVALIGTLLILGANHLATNWQPIEGGVGWAGMTDPATRVTYQNLGLVTVYLGLMMAATTIRNWIDKGRKPKLMLHARKFSVGH